jgi:hypothetical protein
MKKYTHNFFINKINGKKIVEKFINNINRHFPKITIISDGHEISFKTYY